MDVDNLISGSSVFSKSTLYIWKFSVHVLKPNLKDFENYLASMLNEHNSMVVCGSDGKASACNAGDPGSIPGSGRSPGEGNGNPFQHPCLENPMDGGA